MALSRILKHGGSNYDLNMKTSSQLFNYPEGKKKTWQSSLCVNNHLIHAMGITIPKFQKIT